MMHLKYMTQTYNLISLTDFLDAIYFKDEVNIPPNAMVITFDDGWKENYNLLPIIRKYRFRPTIFLTSHLINTGRHFWWTVCSSNEIERLKTLPNKQRLEELRKRYSYDPDKEYPDARQTLNLKEIEEMKDYIDFGLHTCYHPVLTTCSTEEKYKEIVECKMEIERILDCTVSTFAYPDGEYDEDCTRILKDNGLKIARTTDAGWNGKFSDPYKLKVTGVSDDSPLTKLIAELTGIPLFFQYLIFKGGFNGLKNKIR
jgi:peptidoglycan/xylan/chitin deacetylase (PgdA/CDA1 family)